jgi:hypothetical protein
MRYNLFYYKCTSYWTGVAWPLKFIHPLGNYKAAGISSGAQPRFQSWGSNPPPSSPSPPSLPSPPLRQTRPFPAALDAAPPKTGVRGYNPRKIF